jgi:uncharacterized protein (DUF302 family)
MKKKNILLTTLFSAAILVSGSAFAGSLVTVTSNQNFQNTISTLKEAVSDNQMMIMGHLNQGNALSMTGLNMKGESFLIGNPEMGKKIMGMFPEAGVVLPLRMYVWEQGNTTKIGWNSPTTTFEMISPKLSMAGKMLETKIQNIAVQSAS